MLGSRCSIINRLFNPLPNFYLGLKTVETRDSVAGCPTLRIPANSRYSQPSHIHNAQLGVHKILTHGDKQIVLNSVLNNRMDSNYLAGYNYWFVQEIPVVVKKLPVTKF